ncbi:MAG: 50S ribosomal protein L6 [Candidatus Binatus sp.]|uniref:50S ribosomal protein L6 n=1 Tax=Candidatus Binatus sp. TaxID=2811406 RepID=UPI0027285E6D|nr:50S ribosomal protein L6 [Candidatus Binatus sp.]MDO8434449.1 50S ribosomal protein L6 [Candidatus Binatus sp.]
MSRIGKLPIPLDKSVKATLTGDMLKVEGPKGKLELKVQPGFKVEITDGQIVVRRPGDTGNDRAVHGLMRKLIANMVEGVGKGFKRVLEINGVGYRAEAKGAQVNLTLGYSHPIVYQLPPGVTAKVEKLVTVTLESADRQLLGTVAAQIRELRPPEPYKGKGIKYSNETIRRKAGKAAAGSTSS